MAITFSVLGMESSFWAIKQSKDIIRIQVKPKKVPKTVEPSEPLLEDWYSGTSRELSVSLSMDWEMSWSSSMLPMKSSSAHRGLPNTESSRGEGGW